MQGQPLLPGQHLPRQLDLLHHFANNPLVDLHSACLAAFQNIDHQLARQLCMRATSVSKIRKKTSLCILSLVSPSSLAYCSTIMHCVVFGVPRGVFQISTQAFMTHPIFNPDSSSAAGDSSSDGRKNSDADGNKGGSKSAAMQAAAQFKSHHARREAARIAA